MTKDEATKLLADHKQAMNDVARLKYACIELTTALERTKAENQRLQIAIAQNADAMTVLQMIFTDPNIKPEVRALAAKAVLPHQHPQLSIRGYANMTFLSERLDQLNRERRAALIEQNPKPAA